MNIPKTDASFGREATTRKLSHKQWFMAGVTVALLAVLFLYTGYHDVRDRVHGKYWKEWQQFRSDYFPSKLDRTCEAAEIGCSYAERFHLVDQLEAAVGPIFTSTRWCYRKEGGCYVGNIDQNIHLEEMLSIPGNQVILQQTDGDLKKWTTSKY